MPDDTAVSTALATAEQAASPTTGLLNFVAQAVSDPNIDVAKLEALLRMQREIVADTAKTAFTAALHGLQAAMPRVKKNGVIKLVKDGVDRGSIPFAKFEDMDTALRPLLNEFGFSVSFDMQTREGGGGVITGTLLHADGYSKTASIPLALDTGPGRNNLQAMGSTLSYGKRYILEMLFNIVREGEDDDGVSGGTRYITQEQANELRALAKVAGRQEGPLLDRLFTGTARSFEEVQVAAFIVVKNTLDSIIHQKKAKADAAN